MSIYVYIYTHVYTCVYIHTRVCVCVYIYIYRYIAAVALILCPESIPNPQGGLTMVSTIYVSANHNTSMIVQLHM